MSWEPKPISYASKESFYKELLTEFQAIQDFNWIADCANLSALLYFHLPKINWAGFYFMNDSKTELILGPFQGQVACVRIPIGKGVCGTAALRQTTQLVPDVHEFPGHIACDSRSRSEVVIPLIRAGEVLGVLDLDSPEVNRFDSTDTRYLEELAQQLLKPQPAGSDKK